jgi:DNA-binding MarR family transcriptional regulator
LSGKRKPPHNIRPLEAYGYPALSVGRERRSREISLTKSGRKILAEAKPPLAAGKRSLSPKSV